MLAEVSDVRQPSEISLRAQTAQPTVAVEQTWSQPYQARLDTVAVSTETHVIATSRVEETWFQPRFDTVAFETQPAQVEVVQPAAVVMVPALFQFMFNVAATAGSSGSVRAVQPVHGAQPVR